ncbi:MAG: hypothetical protein IT298_09265 [Chloroflexi bacterium]|jgi:hypothetical protein|nr:hypothetical protein [Chloroflexota bacterium]MBV6435417.1 hypothetical protein [Anaerolineae bacterium]MDL1915291.1 hypothetical protein [Anaerolineae bacterium CFX4]OQY86493.1 MAG: hypothetical protein B6D42_01160 [Anaerolineae bacterium UTCFX5]MCC6565937.1 hypothetical protein [Chloroflexota bacterium]
MPRTQQLLDDLSGDTHFGVLIMAQLDAVPETLQFIVSAADEIPGQPALVDRRRYVVRAIGVAEHNLSLGLFNTIRILDEHPLLNAYNHDPTALFFRGQPDDASALFIDLMQAYASTFGPWRHPPQYLNTSKPLLSLLQSGGDLLGQMPLSLAQSLAAVLELHGLETHMVSEPLKPDEHGRSRQRKVLILDESYVIAFDFSVEYLGKA